MITTCDMCGTEIIDSKYSCGTWKNKEDVGDDPFLKALECFHNMKRCTLTADSPHLGCAIVLFRGDYKDCKRVEKFIYELKGRPFYKEE
jgi:hypothetical protein